MQAFALTAVQKRISKCSMFLDTKVSFGLSTEIMMIVVIMIGLSYRGRSVGGQPV